MVRSGAKLFWTKTLLNFALKTLSNSFFQKTRFRLEFLYSIAPHQFYGPHGLDGAIGGKSVAVRSFDLPKKHIFSRDENQNGPSLKDPLQVSDGPITRSRAKKIKEAMQGLVQSTWDEARITVHAGVFVGKKSSS